MKQKWLRKSFAMTELGFYGRYIYVLIGLVVCLNTSYGQVLDTTYVNVNWKNIRLTQAFSNIQEQTDFNFTYDFEAIKNIFISDKNQRIKLVDLLKYIASKTDLHFTVENEIIYVARDPFNTPANDRPKRRRLHLKIPKIHQINFQNLDDQKIIYKVSKKERLNEKSFVGTILDKEGTPLVGASVLVKETGIGTISDLEGKFALVTPSEKVFTLVVSYIGYQTKTLSISYQSKMKIILEPNVTDLGQVLVIGYGTGTKEKFNGAVSRMDKHKLNRFSSANFEQLMMGNLAGVQIFGNGKNPGENSVIQIRGLTTLTAGTNPLIVVDGVPLTEGASLSSVNNQDIASIDVLKDAASAAIYGSRASNGVILVTTKKKKPSKSEQSVNGKLDVTYDAYFGFQDRIDQFELADAYETARFDYDARNFGYVSGGVGRSITDNNLTRDTNGGGKRSRIQDFLPEYLKGTKGLTNTNWLDAVFRTAPLQNHYINLSGSSSHTGYSISFGYFDQENIIIDSDYKRYTNSIQLNTLISDFIQVGFSSNVSYVRSNPTGEAGWARYSLRNRDQPDPAFSVILMHPYYPIKRADGSYALSLQLDDNNLNWDGPIAENTIAQVKLSDFSENAFRVFGNAYAEVGPFHGLKFKTQFGGDYNAIQESFFAPSTFGNYRIPANENRAQSFSEEYNRQNFIFDQIVSYHNTKDQHEVGVVLGYSYQQETQNRIRLTSDNFADDNLRNIAGATDVIARATASKWVLESFFSRLQYDFNNRYSVAASFRRDGSSRFGVNTKYGDFASFSLGWTISNESFFLENRILSFAKFRFSWGQTGNNQIGDFASIALIDEDNYVFNDNLTAGAYIRTSPNADLSWETNTAFNLGLDLGFLKNKVLLTAEYYTSNTKDLLLNVPVPQQSGFSESIQNIGELANKGFELELSGKQFKLGQLGFGFNANITTNKNRVVALGGGQQQLIVNNGGIDFLTKVGEGVAQFYVYDILGVYRSSAALENDPITPLPGTEVGDYKVKDVNGDGRITPDDRTPIGDYNPDYTYGFGIHFNVRGFDLTAQFYGVEGRKAADRMVYYTESGEGFFVPSQYYVDHYFSERNPDGFFRRPDFSSFSSAGRLTRSSNLAVLDADYFRFRSLQIGYSFPKKYVQRWNLESLRIYFTANNLFNISNFRGYNPDGIDTRSNSRQTLTRGWIQSASPLTRFMAIGANIKF